MKAKVIKTELAVERKQYFYLEQTDSDTLEAIEYDILENGLTPEEVRSIWRRRSGQESMGQVVYLAACYIARQAEAG